MREVDDPHHAENERESAAHQKQQRSIGNSVERLDQPELRVHPCGGLRDRNGCTSLPYDGAIRHLGRWPQSAASLLRVACGLLAAPPVGYLRRFGRFGVATFLGGMIGNRR